MAFFSAWDWDRNAYRVYATPQRVSVGDDPEPPRPRGAGELGAVPDQDVKSLPLGARFVGYSPMARGEIVRLNAGALGALGFGEMTAGDIGRVVLLLAFGGLVGYAAGKSM